MHLMEEFELLKASLCEGISCPLLWISSCLLSGSTWNCVSDSAGTSPHELVKLNQAHKGRSSPGRSLDLADTVATEPASFPFKISPPPHLCDCPILLILPSPTPLSGLGWWSSRICFHIWPTACCSGEPMCACHFLQSTERHWNEHSRGNMHS